MHLIQVGRRRLNLEYLVMDEEYDGTDETRNIPAGGIRVSMECGEQFNLASAEADVYRRQVLLVLATDPGPPLAAPPSHTLDVDPKSGAVIPRRKRVRKEGS